MDEVERLVAGPYADAVVDAVPTTSTCPVARIVVYNPLPWKRDGEVTLNVFHLPHGVSLKPVDGGPLIPISQEGPAIEDPYRVIRFVAKDVPPLGYRTYVVSDEQPPPAAAGRRRENRRHRKPVLQGDARRRSAAASPA